VVNVIGLYATNMFVGGMPECVDIWRNTKGLAKMFDAQSDLVETFRQDFSKYAPHELALCISKLFFIALQNIQKHQ